MFHPRVLFRTLLPVLALVLLLAGCIMPARDEPPPAEAAETGVGAVAEPEQVQTVTVTTNANVRAGPGTDHAARFWLPTNTEVVVTGRNADGTWLQIEHEGRTGWIFGALTDIGAEALAALPDTMPADMTAAEPAPTPETVAPTPEPTPEPTVEPTVEPMPGTPNPHQRQRPQPSQRLRSPARSSTCAAARAPSIATDGQVRAGDQLQRHGPQRRRQLAAHHAPRGDRRTGLDLRPADRHRCRHRADTGRGATTRSGLSVATPPEPDEPTAPGAERDQETPAGIRLPDLSPTARSGTPSMQTKSTSSQITDWYGLNLATRWRHHQPAWSLTHHLSPLGASMLLWLPDQ